MKKLHPAARLQAFLFLGWAFVWLAGSILPGGVGSLLLRLRDLIFLVFGLATFWIGWKLWTRQEWIFSPLLWIYTGLLRKTAGSKNASAFQRSLRTQASMRTMGSIHLLVGAMCSFTTLVYLVLL